MTTIRLEQPTADRDAVLSLRPAVLEFAVAMELKLRKNDHKTGWRDQPIEAHLKLLRIEMMEFDVALEFLGDEIAATECVDIANFALIIRDKLKQRIATKAKAQTTILTGPRPPAGLDIP